MEEVSIAEPKRAEMRSIIKEFSVDASILGISGIARSKTVWNPLFWSSSLLAFTGVMLYLSLKRSWRTIVIQLRHRWVSSWNGHRPFQPWLSVITLRCAMTKSLVRFGITPLHLNWPVRWIQVHSLQSKYPMCKSSCTVSSIEMKRWEAVSIHSRRCWCNAPTMGSHVLQWISRRLPHLCMAIATHSMLSWRMSSTMAFNTKLITEELVYSSYGLTCIVINLSPMWLMVRLIFHSISIWISPFFSPRMSRNRNDGDCSRH